MGADGKLLLRIEAIGGAGHEGVFGDERVADIEDGVADLGVAVGAADVCYDAELGVEVVGGAGGPSDFGVALEVFAGTETEEAATAEELISVSVGLLDVAGDASLTVGVGFPA